MQPSSEHRANDLVRDGVPGRPDRLERTQARSHDPRLDSVESYEARRDSASQLDRTSRLSDAGKSPEYNEHRSTVPALLKRDPQAVSTRPPSETSPSVSTSI
jgi:hypothetical protein